MKFINLKEKSMGFDIKKTANIAEEAIKSLQKKTLGGVSAESAHAAIKKGINDAVILGEEALGKVAQELQQFKNKSAQEIAELTSKNDQLVLSVKKDAEKTIASANEKAEKTVATVNEKLAKAKAVKSHAKTLDNGNTEIRKVNKNGAVMVKEVTPAGKTVRVEATTLDGSYRKTVYDPSTGKPVKTFTDVNGDKLIEYKDGKLVSAKAINAKKVKPEKAVAISEPQVLSKENCNGFFEIKTQQKMSDGSVIDRIFVDGKVEREYKYLPGGYSTPSEYRSIELTKHPSGHPSPEGTVSFSRNFIKNDTVTHWPKDIEAIFPSGHRYYSETIKDSKTGLELYKRKITFPKSSGIKRYTSSKPYGARDTSVEGKLEMLNGDVYKLDKFALQKTNAELSKYNVTGIFVPTSVTKISKNGVVEKMPEENILTWLESIHPDFNYHLRSAQ